ncbi:hypothetical protein GRF59_07170 [Paenibacillus sp. HJL G12]|uniref:Uncharacterized protein n=1 Tax=Paenibacillus dendrobii TaxID=2691084 RepID=A0A7X3IHH9_9BACL|nr:hypothetical protein [Paenibacillus dendrobii]MWV43411.1 hypothetical protein [Paenibacillus dendrobii]
MNTMPPKTAHTPEGADLLAWQALLRHETLQLVKSGTLLQLVSSPELTDLIARSIAMNKEVSELMHRQF